MKFRMHTGHYVTTLLVFLAVSVGLRCVHAASPANGNAASSSRNPRIIVTTDGEIDDECSMVRFLLYANEWDIEGIVTSSSQYHFARLRMAR